MGEVTADSLVLAALVNEPTVLINQTPFAVVGIVRNVRRSPELLSAVVTTSADAKEVGRTSQLSLLVRTASGAAQQVAEQAPVTLDPFNPGRFEVDAPIDPTSRRAEIEGDVRATMLALSAGVIVHIHVATLYPVLGFGLLAGGWSAIALGATYGFARGIPYLVFFVLGPHSRWKSGYELSLTLDHLRDRVPLINGVVLVAGGLSLALRWTSTMS